MDQGITVGIREHRQVSPPITGVRLNFLDEAHDVDLLGSERFAPFWTQKEINVMQHQNTVLHQLLQQVPWVCLTRWLSVIRPTSTCGV